MTVTRSAKKPKRAKPCSWVEDEDGAWHTLCGYAFEFITDGPGANRMKFCGYCGRKLLEVAYADQERDDE